MRPESLYPPCIERGEEQRIKDLLAEVQADGRSRALLLVGDGGMGKTSLVRRLAETSDDPAIAWLAPIDVDDPQYWMLANLENRIAESLDDTGEYFARYQKELFRLPGTTHDSISRETIISSLGRVKEIFTQCYNEYAERERKTIVIAFDTIETIRHTDLRSTFTQWMKALPKSTLFILSGRRPAAGTIEAVTQDPIATELESPHQNIPVTEVTLDRFNFDHAKSYFDASSISDALEDLNKDKLIYLTKGQPLWLAFLIDYLAGNDLPEETEQPLNYLAANIPYSGESTALGERLHQSFLRRLLAPYRKCDFWHEAIKRLAIVRQPIDQQVWEMLMDDLTLPTGTESLRQAWAELIAMPWVRPRGNGRSVTLHDAVAEAFAQRIFPIHDPGQEWRHRIWRRALDIYARLLEQKERELRPQLAALDAALAKTVGMPPDDLIANSLTVDALRRERDEFRAAKLYYLFLTDYPGGCEMLLAYFAQASQERDLFIQDLLALYLQRFLPGGTVSGAFDDVIRAKLDDFRRWLVEERPDYYITIGLMVAGYFIGAARPQAALDLLDRLPSLREPAARYRARILQGNACMRIPARVTEGLQHFEQALAVATALDLDTADRHQLIAEAHKELGFYHRNIGDWTAADEAYRQAQEALVGAARRAGQPTDLEEIASIQTNWAYVKGLKGDYELGLLLAGQAIRFRHELRTPVREGISWSVCGEVYRYAKRFDKAWTAYATAESLLQERPNWGWLGLIYQEQAICLFQAYQDRIKLTEADPLTEAKRLVTASLDICLNHSIRHYPSALNRAGRIFGHEDFRQGLYYLADGIEQAERLADGWFLLANLVEHAELSYRGFTETGQEQYLSQIRQQAARITAAIGPHVSGNRFPDLTGRWRILQGHLALRDHLHSKNSSALPAALEYYKAGFLNIAEHSPASSSAAMLPAAFKNFEPLFRELPTKEQADWQTELVTAWQGPNAGSAVLLAHLQLLALPADERR